MPSLVRNSFKKLTAERIEEIVKMNKPKTSNEEIIHQIKALQKLTDTDNKKDMIVHLQAIKELIKALK